AVSGLPDVVSVASGEFHTCAARATGAVVCWGNGDNGQLGNGSFAGSLLPVTVSGLSSAVSVAAGFLHTCAVRATGTVACWGNNFDGELGDGGFSASSVPVAVTGLSDAASVAAGENHSCAVRTTGAVVCWGVGGDGQLGNGSFADSSVPVTVTGLSDATSVTVGESHSCAIRGTGQVVCWGLGRNGQLGTSTATSSPVPIAIPGLANAVSLAAGRDHTCAVRGTGAVVCWGYDLHGQLGDGSPWISSVPVAVLGLGSIACTTGPECASGFCVDGACCATACGGNNPGDCQACSMAAGGTADGTCTPLAAATACADDGNVCTLDRCDGTNVTCQHPAGNAGSQCRPAIPSGCDVSESCDGTSTTCPADHFVPAGTTCAAATNMCQTDGVCGGSATCPGPTVIPGCSFATVPGCSGSCAPIDLNGGTGVEGGITVEFQGGVTAGQISVVPCSAGSMPPTGFKIVVGAAGQLCWNIDVSAGVTFTTPPPIVVCVHYPEAIAANESSFQMVHDDGTGYALVTASVDTASNIICGTASSLSPFAIVEPLDATPPVFRNVPGPITAFATATTGARVTYPLPRATDAIDGDRPVTCSRASGATFPVGKTIVTCTAADRSGNVSTATFTVWVQYQAPTDGTFFLPPIRSGGSSIFTIGRAVPVKFKLTGVSAGITNLVAKLVVTKLSNSILGTVTDVGDEDGEDTDFVFKFRPGNKIYDYRWKTTGGTQGTYQLRADLGDGVQHQINISLRSAK
ncbi:MAG TPA: PxKF domain-containing protein, partial [Polyangia bacterium]|nr:PxKF domain-containing protein [Polyangia bacterium]